MRARPPGVSHGGRKGDPRAQAQGQRAGADDRDPVGGGGFLRAGARPAAPLICAFIDAHRDRFGVVPICRALSEQGIAIAPRTYWARRSRPPSQRALRDEALTEILAGIYEPGPDGRRPPECLYGSVKMWEHLNRQGITVAKCTVERLMRAHRWRGVTRARTVRTTVPDPAPCPGPGTWSSGTSRRTGPGSRTWRTSRTCRWTAAGSATPRSSWTAFAGLVAGWECSLSKEAAFVERAIRQAAAWRARQGHPLGRPRHPPQRRRQYTSVHFTETLLLAGLRPSVGTVGDALDNALAETTIGLYKTECIRDGLTVPRRPAAHPG